MTMADRMASSASLTLHEALHLTREDIERMSTSDLVRVLELLLDIMSLAELERLRQFVLFLREGRA